MGKGAAMTALKLCPFCGGTARLVSHRTGEDSMGAYVYCRACDAHSQHFDDAYAPVDEAAAAWNRRADAPELVELVDAVRAVEIDKGDMPCKPSCANIGGYGYCTCGMESKRNTLTTALAAWESLTASKEG